VLAISFKYLYTTYMLQCNHHLQNLATTQTNLHAGIATAKTLTKRLL
jgi:hypothetical protein